MLEIDCRVCANVDMKVDLCKVYGNDPDKAVKNCANDGFKNFVVRGDNLEPVKV